VTDTGGPKGPLPLVLGITGHRDLRPEDGLALAAGVRGIFEELQARYQATSLVLLSSLAEGADRLAGRVALQLGVRLVVPLPMDQVDYENDFTTEASRIEFRDLCKSAARTFVIAHVHGHHGEPPERAYLRAGAYVARNCQILIALWDGVHSRKAGGTSEIVRFKLEGVPEEFDPGLGLFDHHETGPVIQIVTPRAGEPEPAGMLTRVEHAPAASEGQPEAKAASGRAYVLIDKFNRDAIAPAGATAADRERSKKDILPEHERAPLPDPLKATLERYAVADSLAVQFQRRSHRALVVILCLAFLVSFLLQMHIRLRFLFPWDAVQHPWYGVPLLAIDVADPRNQVWLAAYDLLYLIAVAALFAFFWRVRYRDDQKKYLDYRALAEGLRVQFYWRLAGLTESASDYYLRKQKGELDWIRAAIRDLDIVEGIAVPDDHDPPGSLEHRLRLVLRHWVEGQVLYFVGVAQREQVRLRLSAVVQKVRALVLEGADPTRNLLGRAQAQRADRLGRMLQVSGKALLYAVGPCFVLVRAFAPPQHGAAIFLVLLVTILVLLGIYARVRAFAEHAKQCGRMGTIFTGGLRHLDSLLNTAPASVNARRVRDVLQTLGQEALTESGDWVLLHRERPLELPRT